ncbi:hypothetical protein [Aliikangiella coralliicola]|uniref:Uncharacterized protein n=1 Tax=Aliikangiella coralliicola TaxID=2592383 RepID=A0A545U7J0_9GAMM|nr:hypothetical protein [Aliikangiella coralliicola]TQV85437.1 hypothetical protein FLL46_19935 [Aliikangiella coralliicola]
MAFKISAMVAVMVLISACKTLADQKGSPALITNASAETTTLITSRVSEALGGVAVTLSNSVFSKSSQLSIERKQHQNLEQGVIMGRSLEVPHHFRLVKVEQKCFLVYQKTDEKYFLNGVNCRAE